MGRRSRARSRVPRPSRVLPGVLALLGWSLAALGAPRSDSFALGWVRLMKAYTVLGETEKAKQALADARKAFPDNQDAQTAFSTAAKALKIQ